MVVQHLDLKLPKLEEFTPRRNTIKPMAASLKATPRHVQEEVILEVASHLDHYLSKSGICIPFRTHLILAREEQQESNCNDQVFVDEKNVLAGSVTNTICRCGVRR